MPLPRFRIRTLMIAVALAAVYTASAKFVIRCACLTGCCGVVVSRPDFTRLNLRRTAATVVPPLVIVTLSLVEFAALPKKD